jgi:opacity protein-like surface antigen
VAALTAPAPAAPRTSPPAAEGGSYSGAEEDREGHWIGEAGAGFTSSPDTFLLTVEGDYYFDQHVALGPLLQLGLSGDDTIIAPTANVRYVFDAAETPFKPFVQGGAGFAYLEKDGRRGDDDDIGFLFNFGGGTDFRISDNMQLGTGVMFNFLPGDVLGEDYFFSWRVLSVGVRF